MQKPLNCYYMFALLLALLAINSVVQLQLGLGAALAWGSAIVAGLSYYKYSATSRYIHTQIMRFFEKI